MEVSDERKNERKKKALKTTRVFYSAVTYIAAVLAIACLIGIVVAVFMLNFGARSVEKDNLLYILSGSFAGGAALAALLTYLFSKLTTAAAARELDFRERLDGEESFFVGEGTLLTFGEKGITLHGEQDGNGKTVFVPYEETRYISVCTRRRPREKGSWCVGIEIPVKYLSKKENDGGDKVLVQADAKERLYCAIEKHGLTLLGEQPNADRKTNVKFTPVKRFLLPNRNKRKSCLINLIIAAVCLGGGIALGILYSVSVGALLGAVGIVLGLRAGFSFFRAKAVFGVYREGVYWRESGGTESLFVKWDDIKKFDREEKNGYPVIILRCAYGSYSLPAASGAYECMKETEKQRCNAKE